MKLRVALVAVGMLLLGACAPAGDDPTPEPSDDVATDVATPSPEPSPTAEETVDAEPTASPTEDEGEPEEPTAPPDAPSEPPVSQLPASGGWAAVDRSIASDADVDAAGLGEDAVHYLKSRLAEPCDVQFNIFAAHPDGFLVGDEAGICAGAGLFVYGPQGGSMTELVEFTTVQGCGEFSAAGVPEGVPSTGQFPDGLVCEDGGRQSY